MVYLIFAMTPLPPAAPSAVKFPAVVQHDD